jgi:hypoxanthine phosphoribosyltransferase
LEQFEVLIGKEDIQKKVGELGTAISRDYGDQHIILICNLKGAFIFLADLCRSITSPVSVDFIATTSYKGTVSTGDVRIIKDLKMEVHGENVLLVEDIVDTGYTVDYIIRYLRLHGPKSIKVCSMLDKRAVRRIEVPIDYVGFEIDNRFVIGYGLDYDERYRELDCIAELKSG